MTGSDVCGVVIDRGVSDWQIFQQNSNGTADISVSGRWGGAPQGKVEVRIVREDTSDVPALHLNWQKVSTRADGSWSAVIRDVPAGGLYRLETHLKTDDKVPVEWQMRGDIRHFIGVGDLWIIAGQSNSAGYGRGPCYDPPELGIHLFNNAMKWTLAYQPLNDSTDTVHPENREGGNSGQGPWMHFARIVKNTVNVPIGLLQVSRGGSPLCFWNPNDSGEHPLFDLLVRVHKEVGGNVRGILWYQGESEANAESAPTYEKRFISAVKTWRETLKQPDIAVLTVQIGHWFDCPAADQANNRAWSVLREAQRSVPGHLPRVSVVPTIDLTLSDGIHISPFGNLLLAQRVAQSALAVVYGHKVNHLAPQPISIIATQGNTVLEMEFENTTGRIDSVEKSAMPFVVEDDNGNVDVTKIEYQGTASIVLQLARPLSGKAVMHGGYGANPPTMPMDMDRMMPVLAFYNFPVTII